MKYGFEREFFVKIGKEFVLAPKSLPHDDCGYLIEARGEPHYDPHTAAFLLAADEARIRRIALKSVKLVLADTVDLSPELVRTAVRRFGKDPYPVTRGNIYGLSYPADDKRPLAGLHVHFSEEKAFSYHDQQGNAVTRTYVGFMDFPRIILFLDNKFKDVIHAAGRILGEYEVKSHGFEYRSLPASVNPMKVADALSEGKNTDWQVSSVPNSPISSWDAL